MADELSYVLDDERRPLLQRTTRVSGVDARGHPEQLHSGFVEPTYTIGDQLFVDPHPLALPERFDPDEQIAISPQEVAVACSHVEVWRRVASGPHQYALVMEDDVWFHPRFARAVEQAWSDLCARDEDTLFDILYLSYLEVACGAEKVRVSSSLFRPFRGLWYLSGYVLSRRGASELLRSLPIRGPVDLWMNRQFSRLKVYATTRSIIRQRRDESSNNSYSVLPVLSRHGILNSETPGLFREGPTLTPVFAWGHQGSGLTSLAMALSMLGYRCCSDVDGIPEAEMQQLLQGGPDRVFDAYVNVTSLTVHFERLAGLYPTARFIVTSDNADASGPDPRSADSMGVTATSHIANPPHKWRPRAFVFHNHSSNAWRLLCEFLRCVPPASPFPRRADVGHRRLDASTEVSAECLPGTRTLEWDESPWIAATRMPWRGVPSAGHGQIAAGERIGSSEVVDDFRRLDLSRWQLRNDTFPSNLALFLPSNFAADDHGAAQLILRKEDVGVRRYSAAALSSRERFLYGRFEAILRPPHVQGVITGVFLHRNTPWQEIDIEFAGKYSRQMLVNVFYNPGGEGARFDYGDRGTPVLVDLGFQPADDFHAYAIEWGPDELRWYVDGELVYRRANWEPTPIPHLPMQFHVNIWPARSRELAGRLRDGRLPAVCAVKCVRLQSSSPSGRPAEAATLVYSGEEPSELQPT